MRVTAFSVFFTHLKLVVAEHTIQLQCVKESLHLSIVVREIFTVSKACDDFTTAMCLAQGTRFLNSILASLFC